MTIETSIPEGCGFVFAATGPKYITLARRAARSLRLIHPDAEIDLFADTEVDDPVFSQVHMLPDSWFRPKMESLLKSRFDKTMYLDSDIMVVGPLGSVFEVLDRFDLAVCHERLLNTEFTLNIHTREMPYAFATVNGGVLAVRRTEASTAFLELWQETVKSSGAKQDQPSFRELLFDSDLRFYVLPPAYNLMTFNELKSWWGSFGAPRILHYPVLHKRREGPGDPTKPFALRELIGPINALRLRALLHADRKITPDVPDRARNFYWSLEPAPLRWLRNYIKPIYRRYRYRFR